MKRLLAFLLVAMMIFSLAACGNAETPSGSESDNPGVSQNGATSDTGIENNSGTTGPDNTPIPSEGEDEVSDIPATGLPIGWPENDYTKLVPTPNCGGKVSAANEIGKLYSVELNWSMEQGLTYAQLLQDAGFGADCVEKYQKYGYIDLTYNGVNVQLLDLFGTTSISIMPVETE